MGIEDAAAREEILAETRRRLRRLQLQKARQGDNAPPEIEIEIARITKSLGLSETLVASPIESEFVQRIGPENQFAIVTHLVDQINASIALIGKRLDDTKESFDDRLDAVQHYMDERITRIEVGDTTHRTREREERITGQAANRRLILIIGIGLVLFVAVVVVILFFIVRDLMALRIVDR